MRQAELDLARARRVEGGAEARQATQDLGCGIGLDRIEHLRRLERAGEGQIVLLDHVEIDDEAGCSRARLGEERGDLGGHVAARDLGGDHAQVLLCPAPLLLTRAARLRRGCARGTRARLGLECELSAQGSASRSGGVGNSTAGGRATLIGYEHRLLPLGTSVLPALPKETRPSLHNLGGPAARAYASFSLLRRFCRHASVNLRRDKNPIKLECCARRPDRGRRAGDGALARVRFLRHGREK